MDIACPNCAATYRVPEALLAHGKALRCAACGEAWVPEPLPGESPPAAPAPAIPPEPALPEDSPGPPRPAAPRPAPPTTPPPLRSRLGVGGRPGSAATPRPGRLLSLAWLASVACVLLALAGLVVFGDAIAAAWPPFARVTALIGG